MERRAFCFISALSISPCLPPLSVPSALLVHVAYLSTVFYSQDAVLSCSRNHTNTMCMKMWCIVVRGSSWQGLYYFYIHFPRPFPHPFSSPLFLSFFISFIFVSLFCLCFSFLVLIWRSCGESASAQAAMRVGAAAVLVLPLLFGIAAAQCPPAGSVLFEQRFDDLPLTTTSISTKRHNEKEKDKRRSREKRRGEKNRRIIQ